MIYIVTLHNITIPHWERKYSGLTVIKNAVYDRKLVRCSLKKSELVLYYIMLKFTSVLLILLKDNTGFISSTSQRPEWICSCNPLTHNLPQDLWHCHGYLDSPFAQRNSWAPILLNIQISKNWNSKLNPLSLCSMPWRLNREVKDKRENKSQLHVCK